MTVSLTKTIPSSAFYSGSGATTIPLAGVESIDVSSKNSLLKIQIPMSKGRWQGVASSTIKDNTLTRKIYNNSDIGQNSAVDLKKIDDTITIKGWLEDSSTDSAWNKAWKLRAMATSGGHLTTLIIDNLTFPTESVVGGDTYYTILPAFLESVSFTAKADDSTASGELLSTNKSDDRARVEVTLTFYIGTLR